MAPRFYRAGRRQAAMEETRRRIVEATVALHAEQGVLATTYAQIAARADVAVTTVYNYFPRQAELLSACTGHVLSLSPPLGPEIFDGLSDVAARVKALVAAVFACHRFQAPWLRLSIHEAALIPALGEVLAQGRGRMRQLIALALKPRFGPAPPPSTAAFFELLLQFSAWQRLAEDPELRATMPEALAAEALLALLDSEFPQSALPVERRPTKASRRKGKP